MKFLPKGELVYSLDSENKQYKLNAYFVYGRAISVDAIRVELENNNNHKVKNIYWKYPMSTVEMKWIDKNTVVINDIELNIHKDVYEDD